MKAWLIFFLLTACFRRGDTLRETTPSLEPSDYPTLTLNHCADIGEGYGSANNGSGGYKIGVQEFTIFYYIVNFGFMFMVGLLPAWRFLMNVDA